MDHIEGDLSGALLRREDGSLKLNMRELKGERGLGKLRVWQHCPGLP